MIFLGVHYETFPGGGVNPHLSPIVSRVYTGSPTETHSQADPMRKSVDEKSTEAVGLYPLE